MVNRHFVQYYVSNLIGNNSEVVRNEPENFLFSFQSSYFDKISFGTNRETKFKIVLIYDIVYMNEFVAFSSQKAILDAV